MFDDGASPQEEPQSRALEIHLGNHKATLEDDYTHKPSVLAGAEGSVQRLTNRNLFAGWGTPRSYFSEYMPSGRQILSGSLHSPIESYRAYRSDWVGEPSWPPAIAIRKSSVAGLNRIYVSWNGATRVVKWRIEASAAANGRFTTLTTVPWKSFETSSRVPAAKGPYFRIQGLARDGRMLPHGTSTTVYAG